MPATFLLPGPLRSYAGGLTKIVIEPTPSTLASAFEILWKAYPALRDRILTEQSEVRQHINIFVGNENVRYTGGFETPLPDDAEIAIIPAISGGAASFQRTSQNGAPRAADVTEESLPLWRPGRASPFALRTRKFVSRRRSPLANTVRKRDNRT